MISMDQAVLDPRLRQAVLRCSSRLQKARIGGALSFAVRPKDQMFTHS